MRWVASEPRVAAWPRTRRYISRIVRATNFRMGNACVPKRKPTSPLGSDLPESEGCKRIAGLTSVFGALVLLFALAPAPCLALPQTLRVTLDDNYPPYIFRNESGELEGYLPDLWSLWEKQTGTHVQLDATDWALAQRHLYAGEADLIDTIFQTPEREKTLEFSPPYEKIPVSVYVQNGIGGISRPESLIGFVVGAKEGDACIEKLHEAGVTHIQTQASYSLVIDDASSGRTKIFCLDDPPARYLLYKKGEDKHFNSAFTLYTGAFHRAVTRDNTALLADVQKGFDAIPPEDIVRIRKKWFGTPLESSLWRRGVLIGLVVIGVIGAAGLIANQLLQRAVRLKTRQLENERLRLASLIKTIPDLVWLKDPQGTYLACNPRFESFFGASERDIVGKTDYDFVDKVLADSFRTNDQSAVDASAPTVNEEWVTFASDGHRELLETTKTPMRDAQGRLIGVLGIAHDITERKQAEEKINLLAFYDQLTGLPNRALLMDRTSVAMDSAERNNSCGALLFIDLDNFKTLNDTRGHDVGDQLLKKVGERLRAMIRAEDTVARQGGDEFVVLLCDLGHTSTEAAKSAESIANKLLVEVSRVYHVDGVDYHCSISIGIAIFQGRSTSLAELMKQSDLAMYRAKASGGNAVRLFDPGLGAALKERTDLESELRVAITDGQLILHYQPQVLGDGRINGAEVLVRWNHPQRGMIPPAHFIPLAEDANLIQPLGLWVLETACETIAKWAQHPLLSDLTLSVNVSPKQFLQADFADQVSRILSRCAANPHRLKLELTESLLVQDVDKVIEKMHHLKAMGVSFSLDDFGTGYSSLAYLKQLPLDQLKIDQSFVRDLLTDPNDAAIAKTIVALGQSLGLAVIAEGVETLEQKQALASMGCFAYQGYLFSRPVPIDDFVRRLQAM